MQCFLIEFAHARLAVCADGAGGFFLADEGFLAAHAGRRLFGEFHQSAKSGRGDGDGARVFAREELACLFLAEDGFEDAAEGFGELVFEVVFCVDGHVVFEDEDGVFGAFVVGSAAGAFDDHVGNAVAKGRGGAGVSLFHAFGEFNMGLFAGVFSVVLGEGLCDDELGHVDFVLEEVGYGFFDITKHCQWKKARVVDGKPTLVHLEHLDRSRSFARQSQ